MRRWVVWGLCALVLVGFFQPALRLQVSILMLERQVDFSLARFFMPQTGLGWYLWDARELDFFTFVSDSDVISDVGWRVGISVGAYFFALACVLAVIFLWKKWRRGCLVLEGAALGLMAVAGPLMMSVPPLANEVLAEAVRSNVLLALMALFVDISTIIQLELGWGYWLILLGLGALFVTDGIFFLWERGRSK